MTVSIVAREATTGRLGIATASFALAVGSRVPWLRGGVGAVAVQGAAPRSWGNHILDGLQSGRSAPELGAELARLPQASGAQLAVVDSLGYVAVASGSELELEVSEACGEQMCVAANLMERPDVAVAAERAYRAGRDHDLGSRLLAALTAADRTGGDVRGRQSAALRIVGNAEDTGELDLRVDDARDPVGELRRLHRLWRAHRLLQDSRAADGLYRDVSAALEALATAPDDQACLGGAALALLRAGDVDRAVPLLQRLTMIEPRTPQRLRRLMVGGRLDPGPARAALDRIEQRG